MLEALAPSPPPPPALHPFLLLPSVGLWMVISSTHLHWLLRVNLHPPPYSSQRRELRPVPQQRPILAKNRVSFIPVSSLIPPQMLRSLIKVSYGGDSVNVFSTTPGSQKSKGSLVLGHEWKTGPQKQPASWLSAVALGQGILLPAGSSTGAVSLVWVFQWELVNISNDEMLGGLSCPLVFSLLELQCSWCYVACL